MSRSPMSHVEFNKVACRRVDCRGQEPFSGPRGRLLDGLIGR